MDPLSVTASIITLLAAGGNVVSGIERLSSLREAPDVILALNNEISDFRLVIFEVASYLRQEPTRSSPSAQAFSTNVMLILDRARDRLIKLEALIEYRLVLPGTDGRIRLNKIGWTLERQKVKRIQEEIRSLRMNLLAVVGVLISKSTLRLELQMAELRAVGDHLNDQVDRSLATVGATSSTAESLLGEVLHTLAQNQSRAEPHSYNAITASNTSPARLPHSQEVVSTEEEEPVSTGEHAKSHNLRISVNLQRCSLLCTAFCTCRCHIRSTWTSPTWMSPLLGRLFTGYAGLPFLSLACDKSSCLWSSQPSISIQYFFPTWFAQRALYAYLLFSQYHGIEQSLRVSRVVWVGAEIFTKAHSGNTDAVKALLKSRESSPFDVSSAVGGTALGIAASNGRTETCRVLLQEGADPYHQDQRGRTIIYTVWTQILTNEFDTHTSEIMQAIMPAYELDEFGFSPLHQAVLRLKPATIDETLQQYSPWDIDERDAAGRTALSWAAQRRDVDAMMLLLRSGVNPHNVDNVQKSPLFWALRGGSLRCVRLLLENGADLEKPDIYGYTPLLDLACHRADLELLDILLQFRVNVNEQGPEGDSTLLGALEYQNIAFATRLIHYGANIHLTENSGYNALGVAVLFNIHSVIRLLLRRQADHQGTIKQHGSFLHLVAKVADMETLKILTNPDSSLATRDIQVKRSDGLTALEVAKLRKDTTMEWQHAFYAFLWNVDDTKVRVSPSGTGATFGNDGAHAEDSDGEGDVFVDALE